MLDITEIRQRWPSAQWETMDVTFPSTPDTDLTIVHTLRPQTPDSINYLPVRLGQAASVYHDTSASRLAWGTGFIRLRCNVASAKVRLLLWVEEQQPTLTF